LTKHEKQKSLHGKHQFLAGQTSTQLKHQSLLWSAPDDSLFKYEDDPYEASKYEVLRAKWLNESKMLYGEFKPASTAHSLKHSTRQHLPEIVATIKRMLLVDWNDINFVIGSTLPFLIGSEP